MNTSRPLDLDAPLSPLTQARHDFRDTVGEVHRVCSTCAGACPAPQACHLADAQRAQAQTMRRVKPALMVLAGLIAAIAGALLWIRWHS